MSLTEQEDCMTWIWLATHHRCVGAGSHQLMEVDGYPGIDQPVMKPSVAWNCWWRERLHHSHWQMLWIGACLLFLKTTIYPTRHFFSISPHGTHLLFSPKWQQSYLESHVPRWECQILSFTCHQLPTLPGSPLHRLALTAQAIALQHLYYPLFLFTVPFLFYF